MCTCNPIRSTFLKLSLFKKIMRAVSKSIPNLNLTHPADSNNTALQFSYFIAAFIALLIILMVLIYRSKQDQSGRNKHRIKLGKYLFDKRNSMLILKEQKIELTSKEADLLLLLYNAINTTIERDEILNKVCGDEGDYIGRTLDVFISKLRKKLDADPSIKFVNVRGVGYKLIVDE